jgi:hypothetical protein
LLYICCLLPKTRHRTPSNVCHVANMDSWSLSLTPFLPLPITSNVYKYLMSSLRFSFRSFILSSSSCVGLFYAFMFMFSDAIGFSHRIIFFVLFRKQHLQRMINCNFNMKWIDRVLKQSKANHLSCLLDDCKKSELK